MAWPIISVPVTFIIPSGHHHFMRSEAFTISALILAAAILCGCLGGEQEQTTASGLIVKISSPRAGSIITDDKPLTMEATASGGKGPYKYVWSSSLNGRLGEGKSLSIPGARLKKGEHTIIVQATDSRGQHVQGSVIVRAM